MNRRSVLFSVPAVLLAGCAAAPSRPDNATLVKQVTDTGAIDAALVAKQSDISERQLRDLPDHTAYVRPLPPSNTIRTRRLVGASVGVSLTLHRATAVSS